MKKLLIVFMFIPLFVYSKTDSDTITNAQITNIEQRLTKIEQFDFENKFDLLNKRLQNNESMIDKSFSSITTQLSVSEMFVGGVSIILALLGLLLGWYINRKYKEVVNISQKIEQLKLDNENLLSQATIVKENVEQINSDINNNIEEVYKRIRREETISLLDRLVNVPKDISNISHILLSRELESDDFDKLKVAYFKLNSLVYSSNNGYDYKSLYKLLFFQHFFVQSIRDNDIERDIIEFIPQGINSAFENDIEKTTKEFSNFLKNEEISKYSAIISEYFKGLSQSNFKNYKLVYKIFFETINKREKQFELFDAIASIPEIGIVKIEYGNLLKNQYSNVELTEKESNSFDELAKLKAEEINKKENEIAGQEKIKDGINETLSNPSNKPEFIEKKKKEIADIEIKINNINKDINILKV